jgi:hypothetical protein
LYREKLLTFKTGDVNEDCLIAAGLSTLLEKPNKRLVQAELLKIVFAEVNERVSCGIPLLSDLAADLIKMQERWDPAMVTLLNTGIDWMPMIRLTILPDGTRGPSIMLKYIQAIGGTC